MYKTIFEAISNIYPSLTESFVSNLAALLEHLFGFTNSGYYRAVNQAIHKEYGEELREGRIPEHVTNLLNNPTNLGAIIFSENIASDALSRGGFDANLAVQLKSYIVGTIAKDPPYSADPSARFTNSSRLLPDKFKSANSDELAITAGQVDFDPKDAYPVLAFLEGRHDLAIAFTKGNEAKNRPAGFSGVVMKPADLEQATKLVNRFERPN